MSIRHFYITVAISLISSVLCACKPEPAPSEPEDPSDNQETPVTPEDDKKDPVAELELDGYAIFFQDRTSWGATHIYGWNSTDGSVT